MKNDNNIMHNYRFLENNFKNLIKEESEYSNEWFRFFSTMDSSKEFDFSKQSQFQSNEYLIENSISCAVFCPTPSPIFLITSKNFS